MIGNLVTEFAYLIRCKFATVALFTSYLVFCILKIITPIVIVMVNLGFFVLNKTQKG